MVILEALAATGLRSIRYAKEVPGVKRIVANDLSPSAVESLKANISFNNVEHLVIPSHNDASYVAVCAYMPLIILGFCFLSCL